MIDRINKWISTKNDVEFLKESFFHNNKNIKFISGFLFIEQLIYAFFINNKFELISTIHIITSLVSFVFLVSSIILGIKAKKDFSNIYNMYTFVVGGFYFTIAVLRVIFNPEDSVGMLTTFYIAILYGFAFISCVPPIYSFLTYLYGFVLLILLATMHEPDFFPTNYLYDAFANNIIAFFASVITYRRFVTQFESRKKIEENNKKLERLSTTDMLTNLPNRRKTDIEIIKETKKVNRNGGKYCLVMADIDHFKKINDNYGHHVGDRVLVEFAHILKEKLRKSYFVGRWGGEEFLVLMKDTDIDESIKIIENVRETIEKNKFTNNISVTCSFGICMYQQKFDKQDAVRCADKALYKSKDRGRNMVSIYPERS